MAENTSAALPIVGDPNLASELRARADEAAAVVPQILDAAALLRHEDSLPQHLALALHYH